MRLRAALSRGLVLPILLLAALAAAPVAAEVITDSAGTICKNYYASEVNQIDYLTNATYSLQPSPTTYVICPLTRRTTNTNGAWVLVDVYHIGPRTTTCGAYSYHETGALIASASGTWTGSGQHEIPIFLNRPGNSTIWSNYSVLCAIPGYSSGFVTGLILREQ